MNDRAYAQYDIEKKNILVAYLLWLVLGYVGAHRFYLGRVGSGILMLAFTIVIFILTVLTLGLLSFLWVVMFIWWIVDALLIPGMISRTNSEVADRVFTPRSDPRF